VFTGLVEETGTVKGLKPHGEGYLLEVEASVVLEGPESVTPSASTGPARP
jgi:riboflavin synthase alpha subunit